MDVKEAVRLAREYVRDLFADEPIIELGLEEVRYDDSKDEWLVTLGFSRQWDDPQGGAVATIIRRSPSRREYKVVRISEELGRVLDVTNREVPA